ncbi:MAG: hypothetical protein ACREJ5_24995 [Geminicoccaceae bacterium]
MTLRLGLVIGTACLAWTGAADSAGATGDLCARLFVPEGYELGCALESDPAGSGGAAVVRPTDSAFGPLSELTLRRIEEPVDDPAAWLREQLTLDLSAAERALDQLTESADSPITGTPLAEQLQDWREFLGSAATLPLAGCGEPAHRAGSDAWEMTCEWELGPLRQYMRFRLVERAGERYAIRIRTMNQQRLRHLVAIANSF